MSKAQEAIARAAEIRQQFSQREAAIRANPDLTQEARDRQISEAWLEASQQIGRARQELAESQAKRRQELERELFAPTFPYLASEADKIAIRGDYRAALDRAERVQDSDQAAQLLSRAEVTGDRQLAKAIATVSVTRGYSNVLDDYASRRPEAASALRELVSLTQASPAQALGSSIAFSLPRRPAEVAPADDFRAQSLARGEQTSETPA